MIENVDLFMRHPKANGFLKIIPSYKNIKNFRPEQEIIFCSLTLNGHKPRIKKELATLK